MFYRLFIDEVGNGDLAGSAANDNVRFLSLTGILTRVDLHDKRFVEAMTALKMDIFGDPTVILHRRDIVRRDKPPFNMLVDTRLRDRFNDGVLGLIRSLPYIALTVSIDKRQHLERYSAWHFDPYHYCLRCLVERYVRWLMRNDGKGDVVIEARYKAADKRAKASFRSIYDRGTEHLPPSQIQSRLLSHDLRLEPKSANTPGIQLADLIAHPSHRSMRWDRDGRPQTAAADDFGQRIVDILLERRYARHPKSGVIEGWGRKWLP